MAARISRYQVRMDEEILLALKRLADAEERTMAAQLRHMIKTEAAKRGLWTPTRRPLSAVQTPKPHTVSTGS